MEVTVPFNHITLGNLLEIITMIVLASGFFYGMRGALQNLGQRMNQVEGKVEQLTNVLITLAKYEERFLRNEADIWDLKHGRGFVSETPLRQRPGQSSDHHVGRGPRASGDPTPQED